MPQRFYFWDIYSWHYFWPSAPIYLLADTLTKGWLQFPVIWADIWLFIVLFVDVRPTWSSLLTHATCRSVSSQVRCYYVLLAKSVWNVFSYALYTLLFSFHCFLLTQEKINWQNVSSFLFRQKGIVTMLYGRKFQMKQKRVCGNNSC